MANDTFAARQRLDGKAVLVTGATGILGRRFCEGYAELGAAVAVVDLDQAECATFADQLKARHGCDATSIACDVSDPQAVKAMTARAVSALGAIDVVHNNAATKGRDLRAFFAPFEDYSLEVWREIMSVNIDAMFLVAQSVGRHMLERGRGGSIIQMSSIYGVVGADARIYEGSHYLGGPINMPAVYSTSKAAVVGLTRHLATYWGPRGIRVNCIVPGGVESGQNDAFVQRYAQRVPLGRMAHADEIVGLALYLASDAASYMTGQVLAVDGGWTAW